MYHSHNYSGLQQFSPEFLIFGVSQAEHPEIFSDGALRKRRDTDGEADSRLPLPQQKRVSSAEAYLAERLEISRLSAREAL